MKWVLSPYKIFCKLMWMKPVGTMVVTNKGLKAATFSWKDQATDSYLCFLYTTSSSLCFPYIYYLFCPKRIAINFIGRSKLSTTVLSCYYCYYSYHSFCSFEWTTMELSKRIIIGQTASFYTLWKYNPVFMILWKYKHAKSFYATYQIVIRREDMHL